MTTKHITQPEQASMELNHAHWDERVPSHVASDFYDVSGFLQGQCKLKPVDVQEVGDVRGKRLLHLQCHFGLDTLSWARRGAQVVGLDFSASAVEAARDIAARAGIDAEFVCADVHDAPAALGLDGKRSAFDVVVTGVGALCWLPRIDAWARVVSQCVAPGGTLYVREGHPMLWAMDERPCEHGHPVRQPYFETREPFANDEQGSYADGSARFTHTLTHSWNHGLGETVSALVEAGFRLEFLHEHTECDWQAFEHMQQGGHGMWQLPEHRERLPLMYSLRALRL